jgi:hypothetical protein
VCYFSFLLEIKLYRRMCFYLLTLITLAFMTVPSSLSYLFESVGLSE